MPNKVTAALGIEKPIIMAAMYAMSNAKLVAAVSNAGGLGVFGPIPNYQLNKNDASTGASQKSDASSGASQSKNDSNDAYNLLANQIDEVKKLTDKPFGVEQWPLSDKPGDNAETDRQAQMLADKKVPVVVMYTKISKEWVDKYHQLGLKIVYRSNTITPQNARDYIKTGIDVLVATGVDEGGELPQMSIGTFDLIPMIADAVGDDIPLVAAGGIADSRTVRAAFALGAQGVYVGTAFLNAEESPMAESLKKQVAEANAYDLNFYRCPPRFVRSLKSPLSDRLKQMSDEGKSMQEIFDVANHYTGLLPGMLGGDLTGGYATFGNGISLVKDIAPAKEIVDRLYAGVPKEQR